MWLYDYQSPQDNPYKDAPFVSITHMSHVDNLPTWTYPWHTHEGSYELAFIVEGGGSLVVNNQSIPVEAGSVAAIPPKTLHRFTVPAQGKMRYYTLRFFTGTSLWGTTGFFRETGQCRYAGKYSSPPLYAGYLSSPAQPAPGQ